MITDIFDDINAIIQGDSPVDMNPATAANDSVMQKISEKLEALILPPAPVIKPAKATVDRKFDKYWTNTNILNPQILAEFRSERVFPENETLTEPLPTTFTIEGHVSNVKFEEKDLINVVEPSESIVVYSCNYGKKVYPGYVPPQKVKKSNRGRRKVEKQKKPRKKQGDGSSMSSQLTFVTRSREITPVDGIIPSDTRVYKFKIFRNGKIQLPGAKPEIIDDIIACAHIVEDELNNIFPEQVISLTHLNAVMKNYKFCIKMKPGQIINFSLLQNIINEDIKKSKLIWSGHTAAADSPVTDSLAIDSPVTDFFAVTSSVATATSSETSLTPNCLVSWVPPRISHTKYNRMSVKFSIIFHTPREFCLDKTLRLNIWQGGKVNIQGGLDIKHTREICEYLRTLFLMNPALIVTPPPRKVVKTRKTLSMEPNVAIPTEMIVVSEKSLCEHIIDYVNARLDAAFDAIPAERFACLLSSGIDHDSNA